MMSTVALRPTGTSLLRSWQEVVVATVAMINLAACGSSPSPTAPSAVTVATIGVTSASQATASFQLTATARLSDGSARDVTSTATWTSSNALFATVSPTGIVTVVGSGELDVRAVYQNITGTLHLSVNKAFVITLSGAPSASSSPFQLTATARSSDGSTQDVTRTATWASSNAQFASVVAGYVTILGNGAVDLTATYQGMSDTAHVNVSLPQTFTLRGVVDEIAPNVHGIVGARVQIVGGNDTLSDGEGVFAIPRVAAGRILIEYSKAGYQTLETDIVFDGNTQLTVSLSPTPPAGAAGMRAPAR
jgi:Big-like domain-containing protein